ncbi:MAG TPA: divergent polysaccharide deacetylase family protein [Candidatus Humimicrobiaceae bacterium]|nr:divergent polysaccharide deacetylase family protein [Candidatus Humimicrobiaceae bacterium]
MAKKQSKHFLNGLLVFLIIISVAAIVYVLSVQEEKSLIKEPTKETKQIEPKKAIVSKVEKAKPAKEKVSRIIPGAKKEKGKIIVSKIEKMPLPLKQVAIIIDDIGYDLEPVKELLKIDADITFSVLPFLTHSREAAEMLHQAKHDILLHLPMEPVSYPREKPGAGALFTDMNNNELLDQLEKNIDAVPYISGVNNHMGSRFMENREKLTVIFDQLKKRNLFFIDSRTSANSAAFAAAQKVGLQVAERKIFIDNIRNYNEIYNNLIGVINHNGDASPLIVIGHPYPETINALRDAVKVLRGKGILIVPVSRIIKAKALPGVS